MKCIQFLLFLLFFISLVVDVITERKFEPYADDGGTVVGISGEDYCIIAADTRLAAVDQYFIRSRNVSRLFEIEGNIFLASSGCWADSVALAKLMKLKAERYKWDSLRAINVHAMSSLLSNSLYQRRFMPYYSFCTLAGFDSNGRGALYKYDAVGSHERVTATCSGKAEHLLQPMLDEISNLEVDDALWEVGEGGSAFVSTSPLAGCVTHLSLHDAEELILKSFRACAEREITVGDGLEIVSMQREVTNHGEGGRGRNWKIKIKRSFHRLPSH